MPKLVFLIVAAAVSGAATLASELQTNQMGSKDLSRTIDVQGHRGSRGLMPENTIPAFRRALELGVNTLEMDAVISADGKVVVSHEPWMSDEICRTPDGEDILEKDARSFNIYRMTYEEIARFDCGSRGNPRFPQQETFAVPKPLLEDVISMAEAFAAEHDLPTPRYNIEIKSRREDDGIFHPPPAEFAALLYEVLDSTGIVHRTTIQSFDHRALIASRALDHDVALSLLVDNLRGFKRNVAALGFIPQIYSPNFQLISRSLIDIAHEKGVQVVPWTVNDPDQMRRLLEIGVDGLITDFPDVGRRVVDSFAPSTRN